MEMEKKEKKDWILRFACFLTGRNFNIIKNCTEASVANTKRFFAAMLIVVILWAFIGFNFAHRYLKLGPLSSFFVASVLVFIVILVERQIILGSRNWWMNRVRFVLGIVMAIIGSLIIDQFLFREDIELMKMRVYPQKVNQNLAESNKILNEESFALDSIIRKKEEEKKKLLKEISKHPFVRKKSKRIKKIPQRIIRNGIEVDTIVREKEYFYDEVPNPKRDRVRFIEAQIESIIRKKDSIEYKKFHRREEIERKMNSKNGLLDELDLLFKIIFSDLKALAVWLLLFSFFLVLELFVVLVKLVGSDKDDYEAIIEYQKNVYIKRLEHLEQKVYDGLKERVEPGSQNVPFYMEWENKEM